MGSPEEGQNSGIGKLDDQEGGLFLVQGCCVIQSQAASSCSLVGAQHHGMLPYCLRSADLHSSDAYLMHIK